MAWLAGYEDTGPYVGDCGFATTSAAQYAAVMAMIAMLGRRNAGGGQFVDVSMQEVMALGTETAPQFLAMKNIMRRRLGERARQAGIGVYPCADGHVFLYAAESGVGRGWNLLAQWICEAGVPGAAELRDPRWQDNAFKARLEQRTRFDELWRAFAATRDRQWLFHEGQRRRIAISPLNAAADVLADAHLNARGFFDARGWPGAPYQLSATPWRAQRTIGAPNADADFVRAEAQRRRAPAPALPAAGPSALPLAGLRVVDLTWVGAGPFSTKLLADFGAEVWKIESTTRPDQLRRAEPMAAAGGLDASGYFANRNTNKKSVTLDLKRPEDLARVRELLATADIVANSFSPGVMDRLGLSWAEVARINPRAIYLGMPFAGDEGLYRDYLGYGINIATLVGMFGRHALAGRLPVGTGTNFPDHLPNPLHACFAVLAALAWRQHSHKGQRIAVAQVESTLAACPDAVLEVAATGHESPPPAYVEPWRAPHGIFRCAGARIAGARCPSPTTPRSRGCARCSGAPTSAPSARFGERALVDTLVGAWLAQRSAEDAVAALRGAGVAAAIVATPDDLLHHDAQLAARGFWQHLEHPVMGRGVYHGVAAAVLADADAVSHGRTVAWPAQRRAGAAAGRRSSSRISHGFRAARGRGAGPRQRAPLRPRRALAARTHGDPPRSRTRSRRYADRAAGGRRRPRRQGEGAGPVGHRRARAVRRPGLRRAGQMRGDRGAQVFDRPVRAAAGQPQPALPASSARADRRSTATCCRMRPATRSPASR